MVEDDRDKFNNKIKEDTIIEEYTKNNKDR